MSDRTIRTVFLTGASAGIGLATAKALCGAGLEVWGTSRQPSKLPAMAHFHPVQLDLNDPAGIRSAFEKAAGESGGFDALVNNAGDVVNGPLECLVSDGLQGQMQTLFFGPAELIALALPAMRKANAGIIVNVTSLAALFPIPFNAGYSAGKAALSAATECLRLELTGTGIRVVEIRPGDIATEIQRRTRNLDNPQCAAYEPNLGRARGSEENRSLHAPGPEIVAQLILRLMSSQSPAPILNVGSFLEARILPTLSRLVSRRLVQWGQRLMYRLK